MRCRSISAPADEASQRWYRSLESPSLMSMQAVASPDGANIRLLGDSDGQREKIGHISITGNQLSNQSVNLDIRHARGLAIAGNTLFGAAERSIRVRGSDFVTMGSNSIFRNPDYDRQLPGIIDGILIEDSTACALTGPMQLRGQVGPL